jgi:hypothetical protein
MKHLFPVLILVLLVSCQPMDKQASYSINLAGTLGYHPSA